MLARVDRILSMKDEDLSLDDIAEAVSPMPLPDTFAATDVVSRGIVSAGALALFADRHPGVSDLRFAELIAVSVADTLLTSGDAGRDEALSAIATLEEGWAACEKQSCDLVLLRKMGVSTVLMISSASDLLVESGVRVVARVTLTAQIEQMKTRLKA
jgi:hypothetical protein